MEQQLSQPALENKNPDKPKNNRYLIILSIFIFLLSTTSLIIEKMYNKQTTPIILKSPTVINTRNSPTKILSKSHILHVGDFIIDLNTLQCNLTFHASNTPYMRYETQGIKLKSSGPSLSTYAVDPSGKKIHSDPNCSPYQIKTVFSNSSIYNLKPDTLAIYSSKDFNTWTKEKTILDKENRTAIAMVNHFDKFALFGEIYDSTPPVTEAEIIANKAQNNKYYSPIWFILKSKDNEGGLGVDYILIKIDDKDWETYKSDIKFTSTGHHEIQYYSGDKAGNIEDVKTMRFDIIM